ncbi:MAG: DUF3445 domain-containing protein [Pseudomonadota bacterium]
MSGRPDWTLAHAPLAPFAHPRTAVPPGIAPLDEAAWLYDADDRAGQLRLKAAILLGEGTIGAAGDASALGPPAMIHDEGGRAAAEELRDAVLAHAEAAGLGRRDGGHWRSREGAATPLDLDPMTVAGAATAEDWLVMEKRSGDAEHVLTAGVLAFPAFWTLSEKIGRPLLRIHRPVPDYEGDLARRVQRFFDGVRVGRPLWRANWHFSASPDIVTPMGEARKGALYEDRMPQAERAEWLRVERQTILRLPRTGAAVFGVRTLVSQVEGLTDAQWRGLHATLAAMTPAERARKAPEALFRRAAARAAAA